MNRLLLIAVFMLIVIALSGYTTAQYTTTFIDSTRSNRQIQAVIYYPAEIIGSGETFSYIIFGHGWLMNYSYYTTLTDAMIDLGWIIVYPRTEESLFPSHSEFALDLSFLCREVLKENENASSPLHGYLSDLSVVMGHSMGGGAAVLAAGMNNSFASLVTFAAAETSVSAIDGATDVSIPSITFSGSTDTIAPPAQNQIPIYNNLASDYKSYISLNGTGHLDLYNNALISMIIAPWFEYLKTSDYNHIQAFEDILQQNSAALNFQIQDNLVAIDDNTSSLAEFRLNNYPNPFNPQTTISFYLQESSNLKIDIFNCRGQKVKALVDEDFQAGRHNSIWDGYDQNNTKVASGVYYYKLQTPKGQIIKKMLLLK